MDRAGLQPFRTGVLLVPGNELTAAVKSPRFERRARRFNSGETERREVDRRDPGVIKSERLGSGEERDKRAGSQKSSGGGGSEGRWVGSSCGCRGLNRPEWQHGRSLLIHCLRPFRPSSLGQKFQRESGEGQKKKKVFNLTAMDRNKRLSSFFPCWFQKRGRSIGRSSSKSSERC